MNLQEGSSTSVGRHSVTSSCGQRRQMVGEDQKAEEDGVAEYLQGEDHGVQDRVRMKTETSGTSSEGVIFGQISIKFHMSTCFNIFVNFSA